ncbi:hypothetical protein L1987_86112 [Smallanthus sonchifolius]|uniref:Uncharacterized protein n=1 Tax=Smallanthus sonchifolius TaxID=185202 RepID=A0ACB8XXV5_9ASTR|nr:hypothetical protein L1987_86112 [Smallanthus sonchifolius]
MPNTINPPDNTYSMDEDGDEEEDDNDKDEDVGDDDVENIVDDEHENGPDFLKETCHISSFQEPHQNETTNDGSNHLESQFNLLATSLDDSCRAESTPGWSDNFELHNQSNIHLQTSEELAPEDTRYSHTVSTIIHNQLTRWSDSHTTSHHNSVYSTQSSFTTWTSNPHHRLPSGTGSTSQRILKYILFTVPFLHSNIKTVVVDGDASDSVASRLRKTTSHEELSANHVLAERRRREKLNERFITLRTLVPLVTKMDKASILGDTIEYVKQLRKKIQDLEARCRSDNSKRKVRVVEHGSGGGGKKATVATVQVEVSIIENDALVEMQCQHREGLLLDVMKRLRELGVEITTVQSSVDGGMFTAEMRAKVKVRRGNNGKKISITQVKKAIDQIISPL